jgi:hypothetical protein
VLDGLVKDVVTEGNTIDMDKFIPMLSKRVYVTNTECRKVRFTTTYVGCVTQYLFAVVFVARGMWW